MAIWAAALPHRMSVTKQRATAAAPRRFMSGAPEIYFHKSIDNSRLVRTADPARKREIFTFSIAAVFCCAMVLMYIGQHCRSVQCGYNIEAARITRSQLEDVNRTLKLEEASLKEPGRIDVLARQMGFALPAVGQVQRLDETSALDSGAPVMARANSISVISVPN